MNVFSEAAHVSAPRPASHDGAGGEPGHAPHNSHGGGLLLRHEVWGPGPVQAGAGLRGCQAGEVRAGSTRAGNKDPRSFHDHGKGPFY